MSNELKTYIGFVVKSARKKQGWTQEQLAERMDKAVETISNIERGKTWTGLETLSALSDILSVPIRDFMPQESTRSKSANVMKLELELVELVNRLSPDQLASMLKFAKAVLEE